MDSPIPVEVELMYEVMSCISLRCSRILLMRRIPAVISASGALTTVMIICRTVRLQTETYNSPANTRGNLILPKIFQI